MNNKKKHGVKLRELDDLGLSGVDIAQKIKGPAYRRDRRKKEALLAEEVAWNVTVTCVVSQFREPLSICRDIGRRIRRGVREINGKTLVFVKSMQMKGIKDGNAKLIILIFFHEEGSR